MKKDIKKEFEFYCSALVKRNGECGIHILSNNKNNLTHDFHKFVFIC